jgi:hypothetical protein
MAGFKRSSAHDYEPARGGAEGAGDELAKAKQERDWARAELAKAQRQAKAKDLAVARGIINAVRLARIAQLMETERERCVKTGESFSLDFAVKQAIHVDKTKHGEPSIAPVSPRSEPRLAASIDWKKRLQ